MEKITDIDSIIKEIMTQFGNSSDIIVKHFTAKKRKMAILYLDGTLDKQLAEDSLVSPLIATGVASPTLEGLAAVLSTLDSIEESPNVFALSEEIAKINVALIMEGAASLFYVDLKKLPLRSIEEPPSASILKGPREGFIEDIKTNICLLRKKLKTPNLMVETLTIGKRSMTTVGLVYLRDIADQDLIPKIRGKLASINTDAIIDSSYLASQLSEGKYTLFNSTGSSEKPDVISAKLLEGRIAIVVDGSPVVLTVPFMLFEDVQDAYDYYSNPWKASASRIIRIIGALLTVLLPGIYVALQTYHYNLMPLKFLITLLNATSGIPFPPAIEMLLVLIIFEILNEASIRMPRYMGISLSVVGAIVLGDTAVKAGLISSPSVLIAALSGIGIFCIPDQVNTLSVLRMLFYATGAVLGMFGCLIALLVIIPYLAGKSNYGVPYLAPFAPIIEKDLKDSVMKVPNYDIITRPKALNVLNSTRRNPEKDKASKKETR